MPQTYGWLRRTLQEQGIRLDRPDLSDDRPIPEHGLGGTPDGIPPADEVGRIDLASALPPTGIPQLAARRVALGLASESDRSVARAEGQTGGPAPEAAVPPSGGVRPSALDWRNRWGTNWITSVRDQNPCNSCWAFTGTALVESMLKIEHAYWARLSEGDLHDGIGLACDAGNNLGSVSTFLSTHGLADPGCWPYHTDNAPYAPTPDRDGRSVPGTGPGGGALPEG